MKVSTASALVFAAALLALPITGFSQAKIVGGSKANDADYPWMAAIAKSAGGTLYERQFCGGSLIAPDWILTAAHCMKGETAEGLQILVNFTDLDNSAAAEVRGVKGIYLHPSYRNVSGDLFNDVALILLDAPINTITPVAVSTSPYAVTPGDAVRSIGWGETRSTPRYPTVLQQVDLSISPLAKAKRIYGINTLDTRHLAAIGTGKDTCAGDSGGPLFDLDGANGGTKPLLVGITSYGLGCATRNIPGIYTNVGNYISWINEFRAQPTTVDAAVSLSGRGVPLPNGSASPSLLTGSDFGRRVRGGRTVVRQFSISNAAGSLPLSITEAAASGRAFYLKASPSYVFGGSAGTLSVSYRAPFTSRSGKSRSLLSFRTNDPTAPYYAFQILAKYRRGTARRR